MDTSLDVKQAGGDLQVVEIRHRLANCFPFLTGLIQFRLTQASDGESKRQLASLQDAVASLGLLQQRLAAPRVRTAFAITWRKRLTYGGI